MSAVLGSGSGTATIHRNLLPTGFRYILIVNSNIDTVFEMSADGKLPAVHDMMMIKRVESRDTCNVTKHRAVRMARR